MGLFIGTKGHLVLVVYNLSIVRKYLTELPKFHSQTILKSVIVDKQHYLC